MLLRRTDEENTDLEKDREVCLELHKIVSYPMGASEDERRPSSNTSSTTYPRIQGGSLPTDLCNRGAPDASRITKGSGIGMPYQGGQCVVLGDW